ncbi:pepSY-associated TM helix family protein [Mycolicibacterium hassiacum DSM 44199]|uniref:PepSY-associated TM helix family protein n=1 Tax=Mycolicibacterium hassiacum (strain DSM 44199 / CIP 105218 / JCM 12690 / 3849) TaxID=1122247 RepID=K5BG97_MYCHD|nr:PepSY-associated TM helix domain-containing protein [Mycolicibacterium hassiacum]EKF24607.1 pepSY-associated TM helix family protein [Mycolicibacterium hassiacum DSM 44199]MDA4084422.1 peptidase [Mycolicibacterium hassiacum DSM 44199]VCT88899.1 hypothetical protein MHAS_00583 [Mycolicibacterium hassiacum DSM 44199]
MDQQVSLPTAGPAARRGGLVPFLLRLHFYAGVLVGPFLLIATLTGGLYAISPTLEQFVHRDQLRSGSTGPMLPVAEQIRAAMAVRSDLPVTAVRPATEPGETTRVLFDDPALGPSERHAVFIDPVTAAPRGELTVYGNSSALPVRTWIDRLHRDLHLGEPGRVYSELAASWLWVVALAGVVLWVNRFRRRRGDGARLLTIDRTSSGRSRTLNWHGAVGIWIAVGLLFLSATGLSWSHFAGDNIAELRTALHWTTPTVSKSLPADRDAQHTHPDPHGDHHFGAAAERGEADPADPPFTQVDRVLAAARAAGVGGKVEVSIPADRATAFTVTQTRQPWVLSNNAVAVDGTTGAITDVSWFADWPLAAKLTAWGIQLHMGLLFGPANQVVLLGLAVALATVIVRGYLLWWRRRPTRGDGPAGRPPRRGVLRRLPVTGVLLVVAAAVLVGWSLPVLGVSLLAFVVVDVLVGWWQRRRGAVGASVGEGPGLDDLAGDGDRAGQQQARG